MDYWLNVSYLPYFIPIARALTKIRIQTSANGIAPLVVGRATSGVGIGIASAMVPVYQAEIVGA